MATGALAGGSGSGDLRSQAVKRHLAHVRATADALDTRARGPEDARPAGEAGVLVLQYVFKCTDASALPPVQLAPGGRTWVIGRGKHADIRVDSDGLVSKRHALIEGATLIDNASTNGTFVNGERVAQRVLREGDNIVVGSTWLATVKTRPAADRALSPSRAARHNAGADTLRRVEAATLKQQLAPVQGALRVEKEKENETAGESAAESAASGAEEAPEVLASYTLRKGATLVLKRRASMEQAGSELIATAEPQGKDDDDEEEEEEEVKTRTNESKVAGDEDAGDDPLFDADDIGPTLDALVFAPKLGRGLPKPDPPATRAAAAAAAAPAANTAPRTPQPPPPPPPLPPRRPPLSDSQRATLKLLSSPEASEAPAKPAVLSVLAHIAGARQGTLALAPRDAPASPPPPAAGSSPSKLPAATVIPSAAASVASPFKLRIHKQRERARQLRERAASGATGRAEAGPPLNPAAPKDPLAAQLRRRAETLTSAQPQRQPPQQRGSEGAETLPREAVAELERMQELVLHYQTLYLELKQETIEQRRREMRRRLSSAGDDDA